MTSTELLAQRLTRGLELMKMTLDDFTDADMLVRPVPGANHAAWQLGHLTTSEARMVAGAGGRPIPLPGGFAERFSRKTTSADDPAAFPTKTELLDVFTSVRQASVAWVRGLTPDQLDNPAPEPIRALAPTVEHIPALMTEHAALHIGQFQVIRRRLGKRVLF